MISIGYTSCVDDFLSVVEEHRCMLKIESCMLEQGTPYIDAWSEHDRQQSHHLHQGTNITLCILSSNFLRAFVYHSTTRLDFHEDGDIA